MRFSSFRFALPAARSLRLSAYCAALFVVISLCSEHLLHAELGEAALRFGAELGGLVELAPETETLLLDGTRFHHARAVLSATPSVVLDRLEQECDARPSPFTSTLAGLAARAGTLLERYGVSAPARRGVMRYERAGRGVLVCFAAAPGDTSRPPADARLALADARRALTAMLRAFSTNRELSRFGYVRYAYVEPREGGGTRVTSIFSNDVLSLSSLFPETGDGAGTDPHVLPRPPGFRRLLSAGAERLPFGVWLYAGATPPADVLAFYGPWLAAHGFRRVAENGSLGASAYLRHDGLQAFVSVVSDGDQTSVSLVEAGSTEHSPIAAVESEE